MNRGSVFVALALVFVAVASAQSLCPAPNCTFYRLGAAQPWSLITLNGSFNLWENLDVEGRVLVNGDANIASSVGYKLFPKGTTCTELEADGCLDIALAVMGQLVWREGSILNGNAMFSGPASEFPVNAHLSPACEGDLTPLATIQSAVDWTSIVNDLQRLEMLQCRVNGTFASVSGGAVAFSGTNVAGAHERFTVLASDLNNANSLILTNVNNPAEVIITVVGTEDVFIHNLGFLGQFKEHADKVIWIFCDTTSLDFQNVGLEGSFVALHANTTGQWAVVNGNLYVLSFQGTAQISYDPSTACGRRSVYYIATNGSDVTGDGSIENPYATLAYVVTLLEDGDTVLYLPGTYADAGNCDVSIVGLYDITIASASGNSSSVTLFCNASAFIISFTNSSVTVNDMTFVTGDSPIFVVTGSVLALNRDVLISQCVNAIQSTNSQLIITETTLNGGSLLNTLTFCGANTEISISYASLSSVCQNSTCCAAPAVLCGGACCNQTCVLGGLCCPAGAVNCGGVCCTGVCTLNSTSAVCCAAGEEFVGGICCPAGNSECGGQCCPTGLCSSNNTCCAATEDLISGLCCPSGSVVCPGSGVCCPTGLCDSNNTCCAAGSDLIDGNCYPHTCDTFLEVVPQVCTSCWQGRQMLVDVCGSSTCNLIAIENDYQARTGSTCPCYDARTAFVENPNCAVDCYAGVKAFNDFEATAYAIANCTGYVSCSQIVARQTVDAFSCPTPPPPAAPIHNEKDHSKLLKAKKH